MFPQFCASRVSLLGAIALISRTPPGFMLLHRDIHRKDTFSSSIHLAIATTYSWWWVGILFVSFLVPFWILMVGAWLILVGWSTLLLRDWVPPELFGWASILLDFCFHSAQVEISLSLMVDTPILFWSNTPICVVECCHSLWLSASIFGWASHTLWLYTPSFIGGWALYFLRKRIVLICFP